MGESVYTVADSADVQPAAGIPTKGRSITSNTYYDWLLDRAYLLVPAQAYVGQFLATFKEFPPRQKAASFSLDQVMEQLGENIGSP